MFGIVLKKRQRLKYCHIDEIFSTHEKLANQSALRCILAAKYGNKQCGCTVIGLIFLPISFFTLSSSSVFLSFLDMSTNESKLFSSIKYFAADFPDSSLETTFKQNGAIRSFYLTETTTHVICDDFDSNKSELEQAIEIYQTPIVKSKWISACLKCNSLLPIEPYKNTAQLFRSCTFANANLSNEDHQKIYALVTYYGGQWITNLHDSTCTHIICASALPSSNVTEDETINVDERLQTAYEIQSETIHLITPDWIIDCINHNRLLDEVEYHPDLLRDPNDPMDVDEEELDDEQNTSLNNQSTDEQTPTKTSSISHRSQLISKNFFNQSDPTTPPPPSTEPMSGANDSSNPPDSAVKFRYSFAGNDISSSLIFRMLLKQNHFHRNDLVHERQQVLLDHVILKLIPLPMPISMLIKMAIHLQQKMDRYPLFPSKKN